LLPLAKKLTPETLYLWSVIVQTKFPVLAFQILILTLSSAVAILLPLGENLIEYIFDHVSGVLAICLPVK
jgi:hypothetical protein